jgi:hypothetical protein
MNSSIKIFLAVILAVLVLLLFWKVSSENSNRCSLEKALGLMHLPRSTKVVAVQYNRILDEEIEGYLEISPEEFSMLKSGRNFVELPLSSDVYSKTTLRVPPDFVEARFFKWTDGGDVDCLIRASSDNSKVRLTYGHHFR